MQSSNQPAGKVENQVDNLANMVGALLINFGAVELLSIRWADKLSSDAIVRDLAIEMPLGRRILMLKKLIKRAIWPEERKVEAIKLWEAVVVLAKKRNMVAHNPLLLKNEPDGTVSFGIINAKEMKGT